MQVSGEWVKEWRTRVGRRLKGKKLTQPEAGALIGSGETGTTLRAWEKGINAVPATAALAMMAVDAASWCAAENFPPPPALADLVTQYKARIS